MRPLPSSSARLARGGINWVTAVLLLAVTGGGYLGCTYFPVFVLHYEVKQVVHDYMNQAVRDPNDAALVEKMVHKLETLDQQTAPDTDGNLVTGATVQVSPGDVTWERDASGTPPTLHVAFQYTRAIKYPLLDRWTSRTLSVDLFNDLTRPDWGPAR